MSEGLKNKFHRLISKFTNDETLPESFWDEIKNNYSQTGRHYHNLSHLENMICELENVKDQISDFDSVLFSVFYHDVIYNPKAKDNEEKSAEIAMLRCERLKLNPKQALKIYNQIVATKYHVKNVDTDTNYLIDSDLSILGKNWEIYKNYTTQIRKEFSVYPDFIYNHGRKKVLEQFLESEEIYKTKYFYSRYENQARENIRKEINSLKVI